jgi:hypothetical protein
MNLANTEGIVQKISIQDKDALPKIQNFIVDPNQSEALSPKYETKYLTSKKDG